MAFSPTKEIGRLRQFAAELEVFGVGFWCKIEGLRSPFQTAINATLLDENSFIESVRDAASAIVTANQIDSLSSFPFIPRWEITAKGSGLLAASAEVRAVEMLLAASRGEFEKTRGFYRQMLLKSDARKMRTEAIRDSLGNISAH